MKKLFSLAVFMFAIVIMFSGCKKDDNPVNPPTPVVDPLVNTWVSEGSDVAPGLAVVAKSVKIVATFNSNKTYKVVSKDSTGSEVTYEGTWSYTDNAGLTIKSITLNQTIPTSVTSSGIFEVGANGFLTYEIIQTTPALPNFTAATAAEGFGSTKYAGQKLGATWIQKYVPAVPKTEPLVGTWLSDGANVCPGLRAVAKTKKIDAVFNTNNTYKVVATDSSNATVTYEGTFTSELVANTSIRKITLNQTLPTSVTSSGIYRVNTSGMWYEVIQTTPALPNFTAANATEGFGSTKYSGVKLGATWIQKYVKN